MLGIILTILKIILIIIGIILGILLLIIFLTLISPFRYNASAAKENNIDVKGYISWIFGLVRAEYIYNGEDSNIILKYPFSSIVNKKKEKEEPVLAQQLKEEEPIHEEKTETEFAEESTEVNDDDIDTAKDLADEHMGEESMADTVRKGFVEKIREKLIGIKNRLNEKLRRIREFVEDIRSYIDTAKEFSEKYDIKAMITETIKLGSKLFKNMGFKVLEINGIIGFEDPSLTGKILGLTAAAEYIIPGRIYLSGDFEEKRLEGSIELSGRTCLLKLAVPVIIYILRKPVRPIIIDYLRGEK